MNTKDVLALVDRKYKMIKEEAVKEINERIKEAQTEEEKVIKETRNYVEDLMRNMLKAKGMSVSGDTLISVHSYKISYPKVSELCLEKAEIEKEIEKERISFVDEIIVLGIKDELVKEKIKSLLEIK